jgi:hydroxyacylglutathione hydrolase
MIKLKSFVFNAFQVNTYVLSDETGECVIIDAACYDQKERNVLDQYILSNQLKPVRLIHTHGHVDHILGMRYVAEKYKPQIEVHQDDIRLLTDAKKHGLMFGFDVEEPPVVTGYLNEGEDVTFGNSTLKVFHVPGHSMGSVAFYSPEQNFVITGDVLFRGSIGRTDLYGGNYDQLKQSIYNKILILPQDAEVWPGHGPSTTIHDEVMSNPFLT